MSVGHVSRGLEEAGIPTVVIAASPFNPRMEPMTMPRLLLTEHLMGRPIGAPHNKARQRDVIDAAVALLHNATQAGTVEVMDGVYRPK